MSKQCGPPVWSVARHEFSPVQIWPGTARLACRVWAATAARYLTTQIHVCAEISCAFMRRRRPGDQETEDDAFRHKVIER